MNAITISNKERIRAYDRKVILYEWNEAKDFLKTLTKERFKKMFGKDRNCHKVVRVCLNHAKRYGFYNSQHKVNKVISLGFASDVVVPYTYGISSYRVEDLPQTNATKAIQKLCKLGIMTMTQDTQHDEFGNEDMDNISAMRRLQSKGHSGDEYVRPNIYRFNRFVLYVIDNLMSFIELGNKNTWNMIDLDMISKDDIDSFDGSFKSLNRIYDLLHLYLFDNRIIILDKTNYYENTIKQIISSRGIDIVPYLKGKLDSEDRFKMEELIDRELIHYRNEQMVNHSIEQSSNDGVITNKWIAPMLKDVIDSINELNDLLPHTNFRFDVHGSIKEWCGAYFSGRCVCDVTTSRDKVNNQDKCDIPSYQYLDGSSFFKRPRYSERDDRYEVLERLELDPTSDDLYDIKSCLPNLICHYKALLENPNAKWQEIDRHSEVCKKYGLRNRNVAKVGAFRGIFNSWKSDNGFIQGIEQNLMKSNDFDRTNGWYLLECEWMKEHGYMSDKGYISRRIKDAKIPYGYIFSQYCADTFNSALACREMYKNDMFPSDLFIIESRAEVLTMLHFARQGYKVANAYDHLYSDGNIDSNEFHRVFGELADESIKMYIDLRYKVKRNKL